MEEILEGLNPEQREAVETLSGPVLILAGAGSGKTKTLTHRIANLIAHGTDPYNILAVTFTNKAAREMRQRLWWLLEGDESGNPPFHFMPFMGTFHGIAVRILREDGEYLGIPRNFVIYDVDDQIALIKQVMKQHDISVTANLKPKLVQGAISGAKNEGLTPEEYKETAQFPNQRKIARIFKYYERAKDEVGALDFDDLMLRELRLLQQHPKVRKKWQRQFQQILIDEYQDTNHVQYEIVKLLVGEEKNICAVGDDWQSIYSWRGADFTNILHFERDFPGAKVIKLERNYRSTGNILAAAQMVIRNNETRTDKMLYTQTGKGEPVHVEILRDEEAEAMFVASTISLLERQPEFQDYADFAVLYRTNAQSYAFEKAFMNMRIPYKIVGGVRFYDRKEVKDMLAILKLVENQRDKVSLERVVKNVLKGVGEVSLGKVLVAMDQIEGEQPLMDPKILEAVKATKAKQALGKLVGFVRKVEAMGAEPKSGAGEVGTGAEGIELTEELTEETGAAQESIEEPAEGKRGAEPAKIIKMATEYFDFAGTIEGATPDEADERLKNLEVLASNAEGYDSLAEFLADATLMSSADENSAKNSVTLMTIHAAKGLEFPVVFLVGLEDGLFPSSRSVMEGEIEEERRLAYVGMTRAMRQLYLSYAKSRYAFGGRRYNMMSEFLSELGVPARGTGGKLDLDGDGVIDTKNGTMGGELRYLENPNRYEEAEWRSGGVGGTVGGGAGGTVGGGRKWGEEMGDDWGDEFFDDEGDWDEDPFPDDGPVFE